MPTVRLRVTGNEYAAAELMHALEAIEGVERVEEVADLMPHMDDEDSSSAGLPDDESPGLHTIEVDAPETLQVQSDGSALHSIMENLLENACKYSAPGSTVNAQLLTQGGTWELRVADSGVGVPMAERTLIFRKFHRVGSEETRGTKGTGLGLFIVQRLARALGGDVAYRPREPQGSTFVVTFPNP